MEFHEPRVLRPLPPPIAELWEIALNLWWTWQPEAIDTFSRIDAGLWEECGENPIRVLFSVDSKRLEELAQDDGFVERLRQLKQRLDSYLAQPPKPQVEEIASLGKHVIAYFSPEYGLHESIPLYAGGLGILAGDHLKAASDLGLPLVAVGLLYRQGYFRQYLSPQGWQQEEYPRNDFRQMPVEAVVGAGGEPLSIAVEYPDGPVHARVWKIQVGRIPLFLLDTDVEPNSPADREITGQLYGGDQATRLRQEVMLGIGGMRALAALGIEPKVCHMNEGHSALGALERVRLLAENLKMGFGPACEAVAAGGVFTTHTPVPAGNDVFDTGLVERHLAPLARRLMVSTTTLLDLGKVRPNDPAQRFAMPALALRLASQRNAVSRLHGQVARKMWQELWPGLSPEEVPIGHVTNGVHRASWLSPKLWELYDRHLGPEWRERAGERAVWARIQAIPDEELWGVREYLRRRLVERVRARVAHQRERAGMTPAQVEAARELLDPGALTIGFARRFATYKRGSLLFRDAERLRALLTRPHQPVQIVFAGKAHPADHDGKEIIQTVVRHTSLPPFDQAIVFLEDYGIDIARWLLHGVDVWINNPRRPLEACGTSGMKAAMNGALNVSVLDGWWEEGYSPEIGWAIGSGEVYDDFEYQDKVDAEALYGILEDEVVPLFYDRDAAGIPKRWLARVKRSLEVVSLNFDTERMLTEYLERFYFPAAHRWDEATLSRR